MSPIDPVELRRVWGHFATGVTIVTASREGTPCGLTVNSFTSFSLEPPLVLICLNRSARSYPCVEEAGRFAVNVLERGQEELSRRFASREEEGKFAGLSFRPGAKTGAPILDGVHAWLECRVLERFPGGTHTVFVASVESLWAGEGEPLLFHRGRYATLAPLPDR